MPNTLPLSVVCNVAVSISPVAAATPSFSQGLIVGPSTIISAAQRLRQYASTAGMTSDGFTSANPEFVAAEMYFSQTPTPQYVWIGRQDATNSETALQAVTACRLASAAWYMCMVTDAVTADHEAIAAYIEAAAPASQYCYATSDAAVLAGTGGNVALTLQAANYSRTLGIYSTTQSGAAPNNLYAAAAIMGVAMGHNTGLANSNFTLKFQQLVGVIAESSLTLSQVNSIESANCNLYLSFAGTYSWLEQGVAPSGQFFDEILGLDMLVSDMQYAIANLLVTTNVPHNNAGQGQFIAAIDAACDAAVNRGFLSPGTWSGQQLLNLLAGSPLPKGYLNQSQSLALQSQGDKDARKAMPIYSAIIEARSMHSLTIGVSVDR